MVPLIDKIAVLFCLCCNRCFAVTDVVSQGACQTLMTEEHQENEFTKEHVLAYKLSGNEVVVFEGPYICKQCFFPLIAKVAVGIVLSPFLLIGEVVDKSGRSSWIRLHMKKNLDFPLGIETGNRGLVQDFLLKWVDGKIVLRV
jgi:hypothetical protein